MVRLKGCLFVTFHDTVGYLKAHVPHLCQHLHPPQKHGRPVYLVGTLCCKTQGHQCLLLTNNKHDLVYLSFEWLAMN